MDHSYTCSSLQRFLCFIGAVVFLAFAKADAQTNSSTKNETNHSLAAFSIIDINLQQFLELEIKTSDTDDVKLITSQNGEYKNAIVLSSTIRNDSLIITDPIHPTFTFPGDKLSAHKVIDSKATLSIPMNKSLVINVQSADIKIRGCFKNVYVNQLSGSCKIDQLQGDLQYISVYAAISIDLKNYDIQCASRSGKVFDFKKPSFIKYIARLETVYGNISSLKKRIN